MIPIPSSNKKRLSYKYYQLTFILFVSLFKIFGQENITFNFHQTNLKTALTYLIDEHNLVIIFPDNITNYSFSSICENCDSEEAILSILKETNLSLEKLGNQFVIYEKKLKNSFSLYGRSIDKNSGEPIPYSNIYIPQLDIGDISGNDGSFSIQEISEKSCTLSVSYIGYETVTKILYFPKDEIEFHEISLNPKIINSKEISIVGLNREFMARSNSPGQISFSPRHVATLPNLGEIDIFRSIQYLPGVQLALGSTSNLFIRGGSPDQNLVLLDGMTLYQTSHMFGFLSSISPEAIKDVQIFKGHIPAKFGGRTSSVVELSTRSGNNTSLHGSVYGNLMSRGILAEMPIFGRGSVIINNRKSRPSNQFSEVYKSIQKFITGDNKFNLITETGDQNTNQNTEYDLYSSYEDFFSRLSFIISPKHRMTFTLVNCKDSILEERIYYGFSNILESDTAYIREKNTFKSFGQSLNFYSQWNNKYRTHFSISNYSYENKYFSKQTSPYENNNSIIGTANRFHDLSDRSIRFVQQYQNKKNHNISMGFEENYYLLNFKNKNTENASLDSSEMFQDGYLYSFFIRDFWKIKNKWEFDTGIRFSYFQNLDKFYFEPRIAIIYKIDKQLSYELSYGIHNQFIHRIDQENSAWFNNGRWFLSSDKIPTVLSNNYHSGLSWDNTNFRFSTIFYLKALKEFFQFDHSFTPQEYYSSYGKITNSGEGISQGIEIQLRRKTGKITGWLSYHLSKTKYNIFNFNEGKSYYANHDKNREYKVVALGRLFNVNFSASWVFSSGRPYTNLDNVYVVSGSGYEIFTRDNYNGERIQSSHHLDVSFSKTINISKIAVDLGCSIYNLYNKNNIAHKRYNPFSGQISMKDVAMFGITPSIFTKIYF